jgi:hypothetical protein
LIVVVVTATMAHRYSENREDEQHQTERHQQDRVLGRDRSETSLSLSLNVDPFFARISGDRRARGASGSHPHRV